MFCLHHQTLQSVVTATDPLSRLAELVQSFPLHAPALSSLKVLSSVKSEVGDLWTKGFLRYCPSNSLFLSGKRIPLDSATFNIFDVLEEIKDELKQMAVLNSMDLSSGVRKKLQVLAMDISSSNGESSGKDPSSGIIRVDASKGGKSVILFLNNLERDAPYKRWPKTVKQLLYPSWSLHTIARNLYTGNPLIRAPSFTFITAFIACHRPSTTY